MIALMKLDEEEEVCQNRSMWRGINRLEGLLF